MDTTLDSHGQVESRVSVAGNDVALVAAIGAVSVALMQECRRLRCTERSTSVTIYIYARGV